MANVLLVEDEPNIAGIILYKLRREGHVVTHVESAAAAREQQQSWDLVLLDTSLPGEDALALLADMRGACPVAVMTESLDETTPGAGMKMGAAAVVRKPFKPTLLARLVLELAGSNTREVVG